MGIKVLSPDINESDSDFTPRGSDIRFGLSAIRNVGVNVVASIVSTRRSKGRMLSFPDFLDKVDAVACNKKVVESLIKAGAFDSLGHTRAGLLEQHETLIDTVIDVKRKQAEGQFDLFGAVDDDATEPTYGLDVTFSPREWDKTTLLAYEREMLGLYVSDHPLFGVEHLLSARADHTVAGLSDEGITDGKVVTVAGILSGVTRKVTKQGKSWALASLEDLEGAVEVLFFPNTYELVGQYVAEDAIVVVKGRVDRRDDQPRLMAMDLSIPDISAPDLHKPVVLAIPPARCTPPLVERLNEVLASHPGSAEVHLKVNQHVLRAALRVAPTTALMADLKALLGPSAVAS
jgi:DNA polymerase-3 subunit alpha